MRHISPYGSRIRRGACALLVMADGKILLHLRSKDAWIYGGSWAFFGGGVERRESSYQGLSRELGEEIGSRVFPVHRLIDSSRHVKKCGRGFVRVNDDTYYIEVESWRRFHLKEGQDMRLFTLDEALQLKLPPHERKIITMLLHRRQRLAT